MTTESTHYELLGVAADAPKDDIRAAYQDKLADVRDHRANEEASKRPSEKVIQAARDEEAQLRAAWQVLSDPVQRQRYDDQVGIGPAADPDRAEHDEDGEHDDEAADADTPAPPDRPPRGAQSLVTAEGLEIPSTGRRATAAAIDVITMAVLYLVVVVPVFLGLGNTPTATTVAVGVALLLITMYLILPVARGGQTLGKRYTHTMVVDRATGNLPTTGQLIRRYAFPVAAIILLGLTGPLIAVIFAGSFLMNRDQVSLADRFAKTAVVIARYRPTRPA